MCVVGGGFGPCLTHIITTSLMTNLTLPLAPIYTVAAGQNNAITKAYYDHLVGEINRGTVKKAVCRIDHPKFNHTSYHLISI